MSDNYILRKERKSHFTTLPNETVRDQKLSLKSTGLLALMLSNVDNWRFSLRTLSNLKTDGRDSFSAAARELEAAGYLKREALRDDKGRAAGVCWHVADFPAFLADFPPSVADSPYPGNPDTAPPDTGKPATKKTMSTENHLKEKKLSAEDRELLERFFDDDFVGGFSSGILDGLEELLISTWIRRPESDRRADLASVTSYLQKIKGEIRGNGWSLFEMPDEHFERILVEVAAAQFPSQLIQKRKKK